MTSIFDINLSTLESNSEVMDCRFSALLPGGGEKASPEYSLALGDNTKWVWFAELCRGHNKNLIFIPFQALKPFAVSLLVIVSLLFGNSLLWICSRKQRGPCEAWGKLSFLIFSEYSSSTISESL